MTGQFPKQAFARAGTGVFPPGPGADMVASNSAGNPFRSPQSNPPPPFAAMSMTAAGEIEMCCGFGFQNFMDFVIGTGPSPIGLQFSLTALIPGPAAESTPGVCINNFHVNNSFVVKNLDTGSTVLNFAPAALQARLPDTCGGATSTLTFTDSFLSPAVTLPEGNYEIIVDPSGEASIVPSPTSLLFMAIGFVVIVAATGRRNEERGVEEDEDRWDEAAGLSLDVVA